jgi:hypothetical protein
VHQSQHIGEVQYFLHHLLRVWYVAAWNTLTSGTNACCRAIRNQQFIRFTKADLAEREAKMRGAAEAYWEAHPKHRLPQVGRTLRTSRVTMVGVLVHRP